MSVGLFEKVDVVGGQIYKQHGSMVFGCSFLSSPEVLFISGLYVVNMNHYILNKLI
jgi:hypothetical protein